MVFNNTPVSYNNSNGFVNKTVTDVTSWFDCNRIVDSTWRDLVTGVTPAICSMKRYVRFSIYICFFLKKLF